MKLLNVLQASVFAALLATAVGVASTPAHASILTYNVNMNFDPSHQEGGPGVGTITGTFSIDTNSLHLTNINLTEQTNTSDTFGGGFGSPTFTSLNFGNSSVSGAYIGQANYKFGGNPYLFVSIQSTCCVFDTVLVGPWFQFDFAYPQGSSVMPGNFDSITSETRYLWGYVNQASVPEPTTWSMLIAGLGASGSVKRLRRWADRRISPRESRHPNAAC